MSSAEPGAGDTPPAPTGGRRLGLPDLAWRVIGALSRAERRALALRLLDGEAEEVTFRRRGTRWTAFPWDRYISDSLFVAGGYQEREARAVLEWMARHGRFAPPRDVIVDVGANIGTSTVPFALGRPDCRVLAIEPVPDVFAVLCRNVSDNRLAGRVTCVQAAVSADGRDRVEMILPTENGGGGERRRRDHTPPFAARAEVRGRVDVPAAGLSAVLDAHGVPPERVAFVWSDTQGSEVDVIQSGAALWASGVPLFVEFDPETWDGTAGGRALHALARWHFASFIGSEPLMADRGVAPRAVGELESYCDAMGVRGHDVLLLPAGIGDPPGAGRRAPA